MYIYLFYMLFAILTIVFFLKIKKRNNRVVLSETFWLTFPWVICIMLYFFGGITYQYELGLKKTLYIISFLLLINLGIVFGRVFYVKNKLIKQEEPTLNNKKINFTALFWVATLSVIFYTIYIIKTNDITFGSTRSINRNMFATLLIFLSSSSLIIWLYELTYSLINNKKMPLYSYFSFFNFAIPSLLISGRDGILIELLSTFLVFLYCGNINKQRFKKIKSSFNKHKKKAIIIIIILFFYLNFLTNNRYGDDMISRFEWATKAEISDELMTIVGMLGNVGYLFLNFVYYYSSQFVKLAFILDHYNGPFLHGFYQLHIISRRFPPSWGISYINAVNSADELMKFHGYGGLIKMWGTALEGYIYDFGKIGALIMGFISGIIIGKARKKFDGNKSELSIVMQAMICTALFVSVQISPIFDLSWIFPFVWLIVIQIGINNKNTIKTE